MQGVCRGSSLLPRGRPDLGDGTGHSQPPTPSHQATSQYALQAPAHLGGGQTSATALATDSPASSISWSTEKPRGPISSMSSCCACSWPLQQPAAEDHNLSVQLKQWPGRECSPPPPRGHAGSGRAIHAGAEASALCVRVAPQGTAQVAESGQPLGPCLFSQVCGLHGSTRAGCNAQDCGPSRCLSGRQRRRLHPALLPIALSPPCDPAAAALEAHCSRSRAQAPSSREHCCHQLRCA